MRAFILALILLPAPLLAQEPMTAAEFEAYSTGKTITYGMAGIRQAEQYLPGRQVKQAWEGDLCRDGHWYEEGPNICFVYDDDGTPQCWLFHMEGNSLRAQFVADPGGELLEELSSTNAPLPCAGPSVGV